MIVVYAEKEDMGIRYAAALGGINYNGVLITTDNLSDYMQDVKKNLADKQGYLETVYEGKKYIITWGWGHFGTLKDVRDYDNSLDKWSKIPLPFIPQKYEVKRIENKNEFFKKRDDKQFALVKKIFNSDKCELIINATDWEREGELIFAYVYDLTQTKKPYYRLRNTAKTETEIRKAFRNLVDSRTNYPYVLSARARGIADWAVGINMTIAGTRYLSRDRSLLNIGRVLTPTLNLVVERENEIRNFVEETNYGIEATFTLKSGEQYTGKLDDDLFKTKEEADRFMASLSSNGTIESVEAKKERKRPPLLHNTNTLQIEANEKFGYTLEETLNIAQKLYENGYLTYPRVDSQYLTEDKKSDIPKLLGQLVTSKPYMAYSQCSSIPDRYFDNSKVDGHDAIIITDTLPKSLTREQYNVYDLVAKRMLMAASPDAIIEKTVIITDVDSSKFKSNGTRYIEKGWMDLMDSQKEDAVLPNANQGEVVSGEYAVYEQTSKPPKRFTEASLVKAMENCGKRVEDEEAKEYLKRSKGIGRPATRAALVERLISTNYIERKKKTLVPTDKGMQAIQDITIDEIKSPLLTADWERALDVIELSNPTESVQELKKFIDSIHTTIEKWCNEMRNNQVEQTGGNDLGIECPSCGMPIVEGKDNYYCLGYKNGCVFSIPKKLSGKTISKTNVKALVKDGHSPIIKGFKGKSGKVFDARLKLVPACKCTSCGAKQAMADKCYKCGSPVEPVTGQLTKFDFSR